MDGSSAGRSDATVPENESHDTLTRDVGADDSDRRARHTMLELRHLTRRYGSTVALNDLSLTVSPAQMYGFVGTNGAGKTTAMRIVLGVLSADAGDVAWDGQVLDADARREFGYMPEERGLYPKMAVLDQLVYLARLHGLPTPDATASASELLEALGLAERSGDKVEALSLGNQQRVQLAAALVHRPSVLVLDEPFSGLDPMGVDAMAAVLRQRVDNGAAVIFSSHQLDLVERLCDAVGIIRDGTLVASGTVEELRGRGGRRIVVDSSAPPGWATATATATGATLVNDDGRSAVFGLTDDYDDQVLLAAAQAAGPVHRFAPLRATLVELFRDVVTDDPAPTTAEEVPA